MSIAANNLFSKDGFFWWMGVVEDRMDPLKLGRCRVRIIGYHTDDTSILPTEDLPWSYPMQGITSAALSGKGETPVGPLEGTWVIGFFADGKDCQQPIMMGTLGGIPQSSAACEQQQAKQAEITNVQRDSNGNVVRDENGKAIEVTPTPTLPSSTPSKSISSDLPPLTQQEIQSLMDYIANAESSSVPGGAQNYSIFNKAGSGFVGKYQVGAQVLQTQGYLSPPPPPAKARKNSELSNPAIWTNKNGIANLDDFLANKNNVQENVMFANLKQNYNSLKQWGYITSDSDKGRVAGLLSAAHLSPQGAINVAKGGDFTDGFINASERYKLGALAVKGDITLPVKPATMATRDSSSNVPPVSAAGPLNNPSMGRPRSYSDPNGVYPKCVYTSRQDTNKLATNNDNLKGTPQSTKEAEREVEITTANGANGGGWEEPKSAYAAKYPFNHVKETESGHIIELDDTPNAERIHIYHKSGTFIEIDREGTVSMKVKGDNYEIFTRNNRVYTKGNWDVSVDGAASLLVKNTLDVEVFGKTTINIRNDADVNISGTLNLKAQNINMEAQQDINIVAGNYMNVKTGGDLNFIVGGNEEHSIGSDFDLDANDINLNSGTSIPFAASLSGLDDGFVSNIIGDGFEATGLSPLPINIADPSNSISKSLSNVLAGFGAVTGGVNAVSSLIQGGNLGSIVNTLGINGLSNILTKSGYPSIDSIFNKVGLSGINIENALSIGGFSGLNDTIRTVSGGLDGLQGVLQQAGVDLRSAIGNISGELQDEIMTTLNNSGLVPTEAITKGEALLASFVQNGATRIDTTLPQILNSVAVDATEFQSWGYFPDTAQLSKSFNLGDLSSRVVDTAFQFGIRDQGDLTKYDIIRNLKSLAVNALDPINDKFPNLVVNDAFRPVTSYLANVSDNNPVTELLNVLNTDTTTTDIVNHINSLNPYNEGKAANLQFVGAKSSDYYDIAQWIKNNVPYDQIRLEYTTLGSETPWITVVHNPDGNRDSTSVDKVVTCLNGKVVSNYLVDLTSV